MRRPPAPFRRLVLGGLALLALAAPALAAAAPDLAERLMRIDRATVWRPVATIPVRFATFHPQGMARIGGDFFVSSVEITRRPARYPEPRDGHAFDPGAGVGHLFRISANGERLADVTLGEGDIYHPGGVDYDGTYLWVPVAEYRPDSRSIIYRIDPRTLAVHEVLRVADHVGAVAHDPVTGVLYGISWGSRRLYTWRLGPAGASQPAVARNPSSYIDYQDCHHLGGARMLCSGVAAYDDPGARTAADSASDSGAPTFKLGGWEIVDLSDHRPVWQSPIPLWTPGGLPMTQNPFVAEVTATGVRGYFMPDDDRSTIYVYDAATPGPEAKDRPGPGNRASASRTGSLRRAP